MAQVRDLREGDRADWEALARDYKLLFGAPVDGEEIRGAWERLTQRQGCIGAAAVADGEIVGFAHVVRHAYLWWDDAYYLQDLFVKEGHRGAGAGTALLAYVRDRSLTEHRRFYWHMEPTAGEAAATLFARFGSRRASVLFEGSSQLRV